MRTEKAEVKEGGETLWKIIRGEGEEKMRDERRRRQGRVLMCLPDVRAQHLVCYSVRMLLLVNISHTMENFVCMSVCSQTPKVP